METQNYVKTKKTLNCIWRYITFARDLYFFVPDVIIENI